MCLILFAWQTHPRYQLVLAANRDEFHARPTAPAAYWKDAPQLLAGRDLEAGGTWLGITQAGRFAAITNYREPPEPEPELRAQQRSRGALVADYLLDEAGPLDSARRLQNSGAHYRGYNLLLGDPQSLAYLQSPLYGTRSSTALLIGHDGEVVFVERQFDPDGQATDTRAETFWLR